MSGLAPVHLVIGDAPPLVERAVAAIVEAVTPLCEPTGFNVSNYRATDAGAMDAALTARTMPMFAERRLVVVRELEAASAELLAALADYAASPASSAVLVLTGEKVPSDAKGADGGARLQAAVRAAGGLRLLSVRDVSPARHAQDRARELGKQLARADAELLVDVVGPDLSRLEREVEKLAVYVGDAAAIGAEDIEEVCALLAQAEVWDLTTAIAARRPDAALATLHRLLEDGQASHMLLAMVAWQLRALLTAAALTRSGIRADQASRRAGLRVGSIDQLAPDLVRGEGVLDVASFSERISAANQAMNSSRAGDRRVFEALVLELCTR